MRALMRLGQVLLCASLSALGGTAYGAVTLPNGQAVPLTNRLQDFMNGSADNNNINEMMNGVMDAQTQPEKFSPLCDFSGRYVAKGGGANFAIGWYNVDDTRPANMPPKYVPVDLGANLNKEAPTSEVFLLFPFSAAVPPANMRDLTAMSIRTHAKYRNGLIGFVLVPNPNGTGSGNATQYHYTEHRFNVFCTLCTNPGPWISTLIYQSKTLPNTFYLGFEDLDFLNAAGNAGINGNDLDYEDFLFRFSGVACVGAGKPCTDMAKQGTCQLGVTECNGAGQIVCKAIAQPTTERCDGLDNDCNGTVDDNAPCGAGLTCSKGRCVGSCLAEFPCPGDLSCDRGRCVDAACVGVDCGTTQSCRAGTCVSPCDGVKCPSPYICAGGKCLDPCTDTATGQPITCGNKQVCVGGACVTSCECLACSDAGTACQASTGKCVEQACVNVMCAAGSTCQAGQCVPTCTGAICPAGQACSAGKCEDIPPVVDPGPGPDPGPITDGIVETGCTCRQAPGGSASTAWAMLSCAVLVGWQASRRRRARA